MNKLLLIYPPNASVDSPYLAGPLLTSFLNMNGIDNVKQIDLNIEMVDYFLSEEGMKILQEEFSRKLLKENKNEFRYQQYYYLSLINKFLVDNIKELKDILYNKKMYITNLWSSEDLLNRFGEILSNVGINEFNISKSDETIFDINNLISSYIDKKLKEIISEDVNEFIGISIIFPNQLNFGLYIANKIKEINSEIKIILGGPVITEFFKSNSENEFILNFVDHIILGEGYSALLDILRYSNKQQIIDGNKTKFINPDEILIPNFSGLNLDKYINTEKVLPIYPARGCYWGKCSFCNIHKYEKGYLVKNYDVTVENMQYLNEKYGVKYFYFSCDVLAPKDLIEISKRINEKNLDLKWQCEIRFEKAFNNPEIIKQLKLGGCNLVRFGLESGSDRILGLMKKGIDLNVASKILRLFKENDIYTAVYAIVGFPEETVEDINETRRFLIENKEFIDFAGLHMFKLISETSIYDDVKKNKCKMVNSELVKKEFNKLNDEISNYISIEGIPTSKIIKNEKQEYMIEDILKENEWCFKCVLSEDIPIYDLKKNDEIIIHVPTGIVIKNN